LPGPNWRGAGEQLPELCLRYEHDEAAEALGRRLHRRRGSRPWRSGPNRTTRVWLEVGAT
jgi:hypothetical protein